jgi:hypothetical protein
MAIKFYDKDGNPVDQYTALDHNGVIKSGFRMRVPLNMMDSCLTDAEAAEIRRETRDPFRPLTDEEKIADIDARNERLSNAWRNPTPLADTRTTVAVNNADGADVYDRYERRLQDAWRAGPANSPATP